MAVVLPTAESELRHVFRTAEGHVPDTLENQKILLDVANDPDAKLSADRYGNEWSARILSDGRQVWTQTRSGQASQRWCQRNPTQLQYKYRTETLMREMAAYKTMVQFLEDRYDRLPTDELGGLLGELALQADGRPADPAVIAEWEHALDQASTAGDEPGVVPMRRAG